LWRLGAVVPRCVGSSLFAETQPPLFLRGDSRSKPSLVATI
jgi:hypothetical protein